MTCFPPIRSCRFGMSIHETSLLRLTLWLVPHWCFVEYNTHRLPIARSCWTCHAESLPSHTTRHCDGTASAQVRTERRMQIGWIHEFDYTGRYKKDYDPRKREPMQRTKMRTDKELW